MIATLLVMAAAAPGVGAEPAQPLFADAVLGRQMSVAEMRRDLVGSTFWADGPTGKSAYLVVASGDLKGVDGGKAFAIRWHFREYDNLFCFDSGDPAADGCVQMVRRGDAISLRRKDGLVELTGKLERGNPFNL